ncbi:nuclease family protein [Asticcacaulis biprosthecium C19]|uniref:Nuclease family protein n=1 Tax=Asticcacaulis biprosthecium C19 TaxID=715226 RepID=F4QR04_9CAUL|nr:thermonuclease family protein [Asticcacaulis biprosthecium]EGF90641.1 nuclease family protein [Asticcacaulis biprosthecium C19]
MAAALANLGLHGNVWTSGMLSRLVSLLMLLVIAGTAQAKPRVLSGKAWAIDGDTIVIKGQHIRLYGIDAFEEGQVCGRMACGGKATVAMEGLIGKGILSCEQQDVDGYGRVVAICKSSSGVDLGREMVRRGLAVAYRSYSTRYLADERWAKANKHGAWAHGFDSPLHWRRTHQ